MSEITVEIDPPEEGCELAAKGLAYAKLEFDGDEFSGWVKPATVHRIVACVKACEGIDNDVLGSTGDVVEARRALERQRDELLAACERAIPLLEKRSHPYNHEYSTLQAIRAAIAKVRA